MALQWITLSDRLISGGPEGKLFGLGLLIQSRGDEHSSVSALPASWLDI